MSKDDAKKVLEHLESAREAASPLKDRSLTEKIEKASEHVKRRNDPDKESTEKKE